MQILISNHPNEVNDFPYLWTYRRSITSRLIGDTWTRSLVRWVSFGPSTINQLHYIVLLQNYSIFVQQWTLKRPKRASGKIAQSFGLRQRAEVCLCVVRIHTHKPTITHTKVQLQHTVTPEMRMPSSNGHVRASDAASTKILSTSVREFWCYRRPCATTKR